MKHYGKKEYTKLYTIMLTVLVVIVFINLLQGMGLKSELIEKVNEAKEQLRPAVIELKVINSDCDDCFDISSNVNSIKGGNVNITKEETLEATEAQELISKYNIKKLPTIIVTGELDKLSLSNFEESNEALIFSHQTPPYVDLELNRVVGRISATIITGESCEQCSDWSQFLAAMKQQGMNINAEKVIDSQSSEARNLIVKHKITKLPTLVFSSEIRAYNNELTQVLPRLGSFAADGTFAITEVPLPYYDLSTNSVRGLVEFIALTTEKCSNCYDVERINRGILANFNLINYATKKVDIDSAEGKELISKYNIKRAPTFLLLGDLDSYPSLKRVWNSVGTVESDKTYVFRDPDSRARPIYYDLTENKVVEGGKQ